MPHSAPSKWFRIAFGIVAALSALILLIGILPREVAHRPSAPLPNPVDLSSILDKPDLSAEDYQLLLQQTGLGSPAIDILRETESGDARIMAFQKTFLTPKEIDCIPLVGGLTREDVRQGGPWPDFVSFQPGDLLLSLSTHPFGWKHGHSRLVFDENTILERSVAHPS